MKTFIINAKVTAETRSQKASITFLDIDFLVMRIKTHGLKIKKVFGSNRYFL